MALLNPPELRPSVMIIIARYLAGRRGQRDNIDRLTAALAPPGLAGVNPDHDVRVNLAAATDIGLLTRSGDDVALDEGILPITRRGDDAIADAIRERVLDEARNTGPWGSQVGARDLTNALSWFLTFSADTSPLQMEGPVRAVKDLQERDFGPRQGANDDDLAGWPIANQYRWNTFRRWSCALGFAWVSPPPRNQLVPDPTRAIRAVLPTVMGRSSELAARDIIDSLASTLPVLDGGRYRLFVEGNWKRPPPEQRRLSAPLSDALERLRLAGDLTFDDRADSPRVVRSDGSTFSHVRPGRKR